MTPKKALGPHGQYLYGFVDRHGHWVIKPVYDNVKPFVSGLAFVEYNCLWGVIDLGSNWVVEPIFGHIWEFVDGIAVAAARREDGECFARCGYIDCKGRWIIPPRFYRAQPFHEGIAKVMERPGEEWKNIDKSGSVVV